MSPLLSVAAFLLLVICFDCSSDHRHDPAQAAAVVQCDSGTVWCPQQQRVESPPQPTRGWR